MTRSRADTTLLLDALEASLPGLLAQYPDDGDFWSAFAGEADVIEDGADIEDERFVRGRIDAMLAKHELIPGDEA